MKRLEPEHIFILLVMLMCLTALVIVAIVAPEAL